MTICTTCRQPIERKGGEWTHVAQPLFQRHHAKPLLTDPRPEWVKRKDAGQLRAKVMPLEGAL